MTTTRAMTTAAAMMTRGLAKRTMKLTMVRRRTTGTTTMTRSGLSRESCRRRSSLLRKSLQTSPLTIHLPRLPLRKEIIQEKKGKRDPTEEVRHYNQDRGINVI